MDGREEVKQRCCFCRTVIEDYKKGRGRPTCARCKLERSAPHCPVCGEPVVGAKKGAAVVFHEECRRCQSCYTHVAPDEYKMLAGRLLCLSCAHLLGKFFLPAWESEVDQTKEIFAAWDTDSSGYISLPEMTRVLQALDPDFSKHDIEELLRGIDADSNGKIDYSEFCDWIMKGDKMIQLGEDSLETQVKALMKNAAHARRYAKMDVYSVILRTNGVYFALENGLLQLESEALHRPRDADDDEEVKCELGEFIVRVEGNAAHFVVHFNSGRRADLRAEGSCDNFGPYQAPEGFCIVGLRTKPQDYDPHHDRVVGVDLAPLQSAASYDIATSMVFVAQNGFLDTLAKFCAKGATVDAFSPGGATALMLAAQNGAVESMRMLLIGKADPSIADPDGWTALTFASRFGCGAAVDTLIQSGDKNDGGKALQEALRNRHGQVARKLLRAGLGQAPAGSFVLEEPLVECSLQTPVVAPSGGAFNGPVTIRISQPDGDPAPRAGETSRIRVLYTIDGSDPFLLGNKVRGPLVISAKFTRLRAVAVRGKERSRLLDSVFRICDYALPDVVVSGCLRIRTFPDAQRMLESCLAQTLQIPCENTRMTLQDGPDEAESAIVWIQVPITDPMPRTRLVVDKPFGSLKGAASRRPFVEKFTEDVVKTTGGKPLVDQFTGDKSNIVLQFSLPRLEVEELGRQLSDPNGYLVRRGKLRDNWKLAHLESSAPLGEKLSMVGFAAALHQELGSKAEVNEVVSVGEGDAGTIAISTPRDQASKIQKKLKKAVDKGLRAYNWALGDVSIHPEECNFNYAINIVTNGMVDPNAVVKQLNAADFGRSFERSVAHCSATAQVAVQTKASKRILSQLMVKLHWEFPTPGEEAYMDCICLAYADEELAEVVDFKSSHRPEISFDGPTSPQARRRALAVDRSIRHSGDMLTDTGCEHQVIVDLQALGHEITDIYFVLSAFDSDDIAKFPNPSIQIYDPTTGYKLTEKTIEAEIHAEAVVMSVLSRSSGSWMVNHLGIPTDGQVDNIGPIRATLGEYQAEFMHEEREELIKMKVLLKCERAILIKGGDAFTRLLHQVMELPQGPFQAVVMCL